MSFQKKTGLTISYASMLILPLVVVIGYYLDAINQGFGSRLALSAAGAVASILITLEIIQREIRRDRDSQWEKVEKLTYADIVFHLSFMSYKIADFLRLSEGVPIPMESFKILSHSISQFEERTPNAIAEIMKEANKFYHQHQVTPTDTTKQTKEDEFNTHEWRLKVGGRLKRLILYYEEIDRSLNDIRIILIPRVLQLSNDQEVNEALIQLDRECLALQMNAHLPEQFMKEGILGNFICEPLIWKMIEFLEPAGKLYGLLWNRLHADSD